MSVKVTNLHLAITATVIATTVGVTGAYVPVLSVVCGIALTLVIPGYALGAALFRPGTLGTLERLLISVGMSVALAVLGGLALNLLPVGLQTVSWSLLLGGVALLALLVALIRRHATPLEPLDLHLRPIQMALLGGALTLMLAAAIISILGAAAQYSGSAAQLWMLPGAVVNEQQTVTIGVDNLGATPLEGSLLVTLGGQVLETLPPLTLDSGAKWQSTLTLPRVSGTSPVLLEVQLQGIGISTSLTRHVSLWLTPTGVVATASPAQTTTTVTP
jgi:hypothetical protein